MIQKAIDFLAQRLNEEPALFYGFVGAVIVLGVVFGLNISDEQTAAILAVTAIILAVLTRQRVTPV